jgi:hypothetical protein
VAFDRVDLIEINHFYDEQGRLVLDQLIFYDWSPSDGRYHVRAWRRVSSPAQIPLRDWRSGDYVAIWHDSKERDVLREVRARSVRETWTQYDPELVEREFLAQEKRRDLCKLSVPPALDFLSQPVERTAERDASTGNTRR